MSTVQSLGARPVTALGEAVAFPSGSGFFATVKVEIPPDMQLVAALFGEVFSGTPGAAFPRVVANLTWGAQFYTRSDSADARDSKTPVPVKLNEGEKGGRLTWTRNDGWPLGVVLVPRSGVFEFGPYKEGSISGPTGALAAVRGLFLPSKTPDLEIRTILAVLRAW